MARAWAYSARPRTVPSLRPRVLAEWILLFWIRNTGLRPGDTAPSRAGCPARANCFHCSGSGGRGQSCHRQCFGQRGGRWCPGAQYQYRGAGSASSCSCKIPPMGGQRGGVCRFVRAANYGTMEKDRYFSDSNTQTLVLQVEGTEGVRNMDAILDVGGFDVLFVGPMICHSLSACRARWTRRRYWL